MISKITEIYGEAFYLLNSKQFKENFLELKHAFTKIYPHFNLAYSYKTNYIPKLCKIVNELGGYAEVVSEMEFELALRIGVSPKKIIWNGPFKQANKIEQILLLGGIVNIDSKVEIEYIKDIAKRYSEHQLNVGIRCNFDINDGVVSRFGLDTNSPEFCDILNILKQLTNVKIIGFQCHFATRSLETWLPRATGMLAIIDKNGILPEYIDLGGGLFGKMEPSLKEQFDSYIPNYHEYASEIAQLFSNKFGKMINPPKLLLEPGSALVGDCMSFFAKVISIKKIRGKNIATVAGSIYNINPTLNKKNPPICIYPMSKNRQIYNNLDFGGFTCIESDYLYKNFTGELGEGDYIEFRNVGSYSIVLKPPFILPNFPILEVENSTIQVIKRKEFFDDIFHTYSF